MAEDFDDIVENDEGASRVAWFLTGAAIGITAALLFAPKTGRETRHFLAEKGEKGKQTVTESTQQIVEGSRELFERGRKLVEDAAELFERGRKLVRG
jgi:gas vesicle protein